MEHIVPFQGAPLVTEEAKVAARLATIPSEEQARKMIAAVIAQAASDIVLGKLQFRSAGEASKVARDFAAIAKDLDWNTEKDELKKAETAEDRQSAFEEFRKRAQKNLDK